MTLCEWHQEKADRDGCWFCEADGVAAERWAGVCEKLTESLKLTIQERDMLAAENKKLWQFVDDCLCECFDEYGERFKEPCDRCKLLANRK